MRQPSGQHYDHFLLYGKIHDSRFWVLAQRLFCRQILKFYVHNSLLSTAASVTMWHQRELKVLYNLAACLANMKDFRLSIDIYKEILARDPSNKSFTYSTMARLYLQVYLHIYVNWILVKARYDPECNTIVIDTLRDENIHST